ncbi:hypothetical protein HGRIS_008490 [Hohenbuehelia grisea]|uniref:Uncharacterized protein n=1 Tax=Hohenbuehelia grisea TaxID=104357 RepID=A0ABR3J856_9AGAR
MDTKPNSESVLPPPHPRRSQSSCNMAHSGAGAEPGINPRRDSALAQFGHIHQASTINVTDYSSEKCTQNTYNNAEFLTMLADSQRSSHRADSGVRWINIGGLSWDVISAVAVKYDLHSLALEDVLQEQGHNHSKADYYPNHLFLRILCHSLASDEGESPSDTAFSETMSTSALIDAVPFARAGSPASMHSSEYPEEGKNDPQKRSRFDILRRRKPHDEEGVAPKQRYFSRQDIRQKFSGLTGFRTAARQRRIMKIQELKKGDRVNVRVAPMYIFLLRDGTVITMHPTPNLVFTEPITSRIQQHDSVLRTSSDASLLVESVLDLVVDRVLEVIDAYQDRIHELENEILLKPTMNTVRSRMCHLSLSLSASPQLLVERC